ncbi:MAG: stage II sporulation protein M [Nitrososphaerota archaeon]
MKPKLIDNGSNNKYQQAPIYVRYLAYLVDMVLLFGMTSLLFSLFGHGPLGFIIISNYSEGIKPLLTHNEYILFYKMMFLYFLIAIIYFYSESLTGVSLGKYLSGIRNAKLNPGKNNTQPRNIFSLLLLKSVVKALPFLQFVDSINIFRGKYRQTLIEKKLSQITVIKEKVSITKRVFIDSLAIYYIPVITGIICIDFLNKSLGLPTPSPSSPFVYDPTLTQVTSIFINNAIIDVYRLVIGGFVFLVLDIMEIITTSYLDALFIGGSINSHPYFILFGVLPHFFVETFGFIFGVVSSVFILNAILDSISGYMQGQPVSFLVNALYSNTKQAGKFLFVSICLLFVSAIIETWVTGFLLYHFYYT